MEYLWNNHSRIQYSSQHFSIAPCDFCYNLQFFALNYVHFFSKIYEGKENFMKTKIVIITSTYLHPFVEKAFEDVQRITKCSTGCGGCHDKIMDTISKIMSK